MDRIRETLAALESLTEAGRTLSAANEAKVRAAIASLHEVLAQLERSYDDEEQAEATEEKAEESLREARTLAEAMLSHDQVRSSLHRALRDAHPRHDEYVYPVDVYDSSVVYRHSQEDGKSRLMRRSYRTNADGAINLGNDAQQVQAVTTYEPINESLNEAQIAELLEADFTADQRKAMATSGEALSDGSYPIPDRAFLEKAIHAIGRGNAPHAEIRAHIIKRAKALNATDLLPEAWNVSEAAQTELVGDLVPLVEKAVRKDGTAPIKLISPGWGTSGYYSADVLKRDGPKVFAKGLHMYLDHPTAAEEAARPERSLKDLAAVLESNARWQDAGPDGPGLYAEAKIRSDVAPLIEELAPHTGVSIRALGVAKAGQAEGRKGPIVEAIGSAKSVDFVTLPGRGGKVLQLMESARARTPHPQQTPPPQQEHPPVDEQLQETQRERDEARAENARLREALVLREARDFVTERLAKADIPDITRARLTESLARTPALKDGALDQAAFGTAIDEAVKAEIEYLARITGSGQIRGMGGSAASHDDASLSESQTRLGDAFARILGNDKTAKVAAAGRN